MLDKISAYDNLIVEINISIKNLKAYPKILSDPTQHHHHLVFEKCLYLALVQNDLAISLKYLDLSNHISNPFETNYFSRITALNCYETLNHLDKSIGKEIQMKYSDISFREELKKVNDGGKSLNILKKKHFQKLEALRNNVIGHKSSDSLKQTDLMLGIDNKEIYDLGREIVVINKQILDAYMELLFKNSSR